MKADFTLKQRQGFWETPRNIAILLAAAATLFTAFGSWVGYTLKSNQMAAPTMIVLPPGTTIQVPPTQIAPSK